MGGLIRLGGQTFAWAMAGQVAVAVAQPVVLSAVSKLAGEYLPVDQRATASRSAPRATSWGSSLALLLGPTVGGHGHLERLLVVEAAMAVVAAVALAVALRRPGRPSAEHAAIEERAARALWALPSMRILSGLVFLGFGIFVALATWLQTLLRSRRRLGSRGGCAAGGDGDRRDSRLCGAAAAASPAGARNACFMRSAVVASCLGCVALGVAPWLGLRAAVIAIMGLFLLPALPIVLAAAERLAGAAAGTAGAIVWMAGNLGGLIVALIVQILVHDPLAAFLAMGAVSLLGLPLAARLAPSASTEDPSGRPAPAAAS